MSETPAAKQSENTKTVTKRPKPKRVLEKSFASDRRGLKNNSDGQGPEDLVLQRRSAGPSVQRVVDQPRIPGPISAHFPRHPHDFTQVPAHTIRPSPAPFKVMSSAGPALVSGKGQTAFMEEQANNRQAGKGESVQTKLLQRSLAGNLSGPAQAAYFRPTNDSLVGDRNGAYRESINNFMEANPKEAILEQQQHLLAGRHQANREISRDHSQTLRRKGGSAKAPTLSMTTLKGPTPSDFGGYSWQIQWHLSEKSKKGGWIVQKIEADGDISTSDSSLASGYEGHAPYWEAWKVNKGQSVTDFAEGGDPDDDLYFNPGYGDGSRGTMKITGTADFYEGLKLPSSFKVLPGNPAGILKATKSDPGLTGGSGTLPHNITAKWDSVEGDGTTEVATG